MNLDLSPSGMTLPLLVAAAAALVAYFLTGKKEAGTEVAGGILSNLSGLLGKSNRLAVLLPLLSAAWKNKDAILGAVQAFAANLKKLVTPPEPPKGNGS